MAQEDDPCDDPGQVILVGVTGVLDTIKACSAGEAVNSLDEMLRIRNLIGSVDQCQLHCSLAPGERFRPACCIKWRQDGALVKQPDWKKEAEPEPHFDLNAEAHMDPDLVDAVRKLPFPSAGTRKEFSKSLSDQGIYKASQLSTFNGELFNGKLGSILGAKLKDEQAEQDAKKGKGTSLDDQIAREKKAAELLGPLQEQVAKDRSSSQTYLSDAVQAMQDATKSGSQALRDRAAQNLAKAQERQGLMLLPALAASSTESSSPPRASSSKRG